MTGRSIPKGIVRDLIIIVVGIALVWIGLQIVFGVPNPFYVVASGSMIPVLEIYDILVVQGNIDFEDIQVGDIIVFNRPSDHERVIVHRVASIIDDDPRTIRTKGDANIASIPGTDFPITEKDYIGKVEFVIPQVGYITQALKPPINYIIISIVIVVMVAKHFMRRGDGRTDTSESAGRSDADGSDTDDGPRLTAKEMADLLKVSTDDSEYVKEQTGSKDTAAESTDDTDGKNDDSDSPPADPKKES